MRQSRLTSYQAHSYGKDSNRMSSQSQQKLIDTLKRNYQAEMEGAATYRALAQREKDAHRADVIRRMADNEEQHATRWAGRLKELGIEPPSGPFKALRSIMLSARASSIDNALRKLEAGEDATVEDYRNQAATLGDAGVSEIATELIKDEQRHSQSLQSMVTNPRDPQSRLSAILRGEKHASTGSWIGDAI